MRHVCSVCAYVYDDDVEGTPFDELPDDWTCPVCTVDKGFFEAEGDGDATSAPAVGVP